MFESGMTKNIYTLIKSWSGEKKQRCTAGNYFQLELLALACLNRRTLALSFQPSTSSNDLNIPLQWKFFKKVILKRASVIEWPWKDINLRNTISSFCFIGTSFYKYKTMECSNLQLKHESKVENRSLEFFQWINYNK